MTDTVQLSREEYESLLQTIEDLEDERDYYHAQWMGETPIPFSQALEEIEVGPMFPLFFLFPDDNDLFFRTRDEIEARIVSLDTDINTSVIIVDWQGREVGLKVEAQKIVRCEVRGEAQPLVLEKMHRVRDHLVAA